MFTSALKIIEKIQKVFAIFLLLGIVIATFLQVFTRYILGNPFMWTEEVARACGIWLVMIVAGVLLKNNDHVGLDLIPEKLQPVRRILTYLLALFFSIWLLFPAFTHVGVSLERLSSATRIPLWIYYVCMPIGFINIIFWGVIGLAKEISLLFKNVKHDPILK
jgi:TRAP-type C4-dicarboxylate transport system permease small subunit